MLKSFLINNFIIITLLFSNASIAQIPALPDVAMKKNQDSGQLDVEMLGLDDLEEVTKSITVENDKSGDNEQSLVKNSKVLTVNNENQEDSKTSQKAKKSNESKSVKDKSQVKSEVSKLPSNESGAKEEVQEEERDGKLGVFSKIKSFIEKSDKISEVINKKVINLKLGSDDENKEKTAKEIEQEERKKLLAEQKKARLEKLKEAYLLRLKEAGGRGKFIVPRKKDLSWSDRFYVTKDMAPPLISRSRNKENSHIPILPTFKEKIFSLFRTVRSNDISAFNNLYRKVAIPDIKNNKGETILTYALLLKRRPVVTSILAKGADPDLPNNLGHTPLDIAIENIDLKSVKILIDNHADIDYSDKYNRTFLMLAARRGYLPIVRLLVDSGADVNKYDNFGRTALSIALRHKKEIIAKFLLKKGALTWIEKPINESRQQFILELQNRWNNSVNIPQ